MIYENFYVYNLLNNPQELMNELNKYKVCATLTGSQLEGYNLKINKNSLKKSKVLDILMKYNFIG